MWLPRAAAPEKARSPAHALAAMRICGIAAACRAAASRASAGSAQASKLPA